MAAEQKTDVRATWKMGEWVNGELRSSDGKIGSIKITREMATPTEIPAASTFVVHHAVAAMMLSCVHGTG
jgi:hypothetical protein